MIIKIDDLGDFMTRFMAAMDVQEPNWYIEHATGEELREYALERRINYHTRNLRQSVANRLAMPVRACVRAGLVTTTY